MRPRLATGAPPRRSTAVLALVVLVVLCAGAGCTPDVSDPLRETGPSVPSSPRLAASLSQYRFQEGTRDRSAAVTNLGSSAVTVSSATLAWPGFTRSAAPVDNGPLAPGRSVGMTLRYGAAQCAAATRDQLDATPSVDLAVTVDGLERLVSLERDDAEVVVRLRVPPPLAEVSELSSTRCVCRRGASRSPRSPPCR